MKRIPMALESIAPHSNGVVVVDFWGGVNCKPDDIKKAQREAGPQLTVLLKNS